MRRSPVTYRRIVLPFVGIFLLAVVAGCSKEAPAPAPVVKKIAPMQSAPPAPAKAAAEGEKKPAPVTVYSSAGKRDPFVPFIKAETKQLRTDLSLLPPLQRYELAELKYVGLIWAKKGARALVEDGEGKGYSVLVGSRIGRMGGVVTRITEKEILVREEFIGTRGDKVFRENALQLTTAGGK
ncbi:MAG: pilus assembly protein PilP [Deltaproteobacteria bacterium]|nr:pilus assembly protein PilP [Deltaproteobacteria bacterium]